MHHASICANVFIGVLFVLCELHVTRVVVVDAVVGLTLGLIAHVVGVVFVVAINIEFFCIWRYTLYRNQMLESLLSLTVETTLVTASSYVGDKRQNGACDSMTSIVDCRQHWREALAKRPRSMCATISTQTGHRI